MENKRDSFTDQIQSLLKDKSHKVVAFVPLESSNLNRCRHLVILRAPSDNTSKHAKHKWYGLTIQCNIMWCGSDYNVIFNPCGSRSQSFSSMSKSAGSRKTPRANHPGVHSDEDFCLLGLDSFLQGEDRVETIRLGLVVKILWGTEVQLDGDGGFR